MQGRLIDADALYTSIALYLAENAYLNDTAQSALEMVANWIKESPTVDAELLVRCKDCKYLMFSDCYGECGAGHIGIVRPDDFCSRGIRKDDHHVDDR